MDKHWKTFFWLMIIFLAALIVVTGCISIGYSGFWNAFWPQFMAILLGIVITVILTYVIWLRQQRHTKSLQRLELLEDLKFEASENLKWLENLKTFLVETSRPEYTSLDRGLSTITMKYALDPQNLVLLKDFDLADDINRTVGHCDEYNDNYHKRFRQLLVDQVVAAGEQDQQQRDRTAFSVEISSDINYIRSILENLMKKLENQTTHS